MSRRKATPAAKTIRIRRIDGARAKAVADEVAVEEPLEIRVEGHSLAVVMRTPGHDRELAAGFLLTEGVVRSAGEIFDIGACGSGANVIQCLLRAGTEFDVARLTRHVFTSSSCGLCGKATIAAALGPRPRPLRDAMRVSAAWLGSLPAQLGEAQPAFRRTGGLHACAIFSAEGGLVAAREDVGRHNALDKLAGWALLQNRLPLRGHALLLSGRSSFEMLQKARASGIALVAAIGAPSSLAVDFAKSAGMTLVGFLREGTMNVYTGSQRVTLK